LINDIFRGYSIQKKVVDFFVRDIGEGRSIAGSFGFLFFPGVFENCGEFGAGPSGPKPHKSQGVFVIEDDDQDSSIVHEGHMKATAFTLMKVGWEFLFTQNLGQTACGRYSAGR
jgi:hypothetical protein